MTKILKLAIFFLISFNIFGQNYDVGTSYFSPNEFAEYIPGNLPIILSAPHGGEKKPDDIPDRDCNGCVVVNDTNTQELLREIANKIAEITGCIPHQIINRLHRSKLDANREIIEAADGNALAEEAWMFYHDHVTVAQNKIELKYNNGLFIDLHGHAHNIQRLELGYLLSKNNLQLDDEDLENDNLINKSSIKNLYEHNHLGLNFTELIRGDQSFGSLIDDKGFRAVPSLDEPFPEDSESYFSGGYNTVTYGSRNSGHIDAIQIECNQDVRFQTSTRKRFADSLAVTIIE